MARLMFAALALAWAWAGWRNMPRLDHPQSAAAGSAIALSIVAAYWLGRRRSREAAISIATARAEATALAAVRSDNRSTATTNVVLNIDPSLGAARAGAVTGLDTAPWMVGAHRSHSELVESETDWTESVMAEFAEEDPA